MPVGLEILANVIDDLPVSVAQWGEVIALGKFLGHVLGPRGHFEQETIPV